MREYDNPLHNCTPEEYAAWHASPEELPSPAISDTGTPEIGSQAWLDSYQDNTEEI